MRCTALLLVSVIGVTAACDGVADPALHPDVTHQLVVQPHGTWGSAVRLDPAGSIGLTTTALEGCPNESPDGRSLFFASNRESPTNIDIYVSHRDSRGEWGEPQKLTGNVNSTANDYCPTALPGGVLLFVSERADGKNCGTGTADIYETRLHPSQGWLEPEHLGCVINSAGHEFAPAYTAAGGGMLFFSSNRTGTHQIYVSSRGPGGEWQPPTIVQELSYPGFNTVRPNVSQDGREIVFDSDRPDGEGMFDVWYARRATPSSAWAAPVNAGAAVNSSSNETRASLSRDGKRLYFGSNRLGNFDIYVAQRR